MILNSPLRKANSALALAAALLMVRELRINEPGRNAWMKLNVTY